MTWQYDLGHSREHYERQAIEAERTTATGTRTLILTQEQLRLIAQWANNEWDTINQGRFWFLPDSPQEKAAFADLAVIEDIQDKLRS